MASIFKRKLKEKRPNTGVACRIRRFTMILSLVIGPVIYFAVAIVVGDGLSFLVNPDWWTGMRGPSMLLIFSLPIFIGIWSIYIVAYLIVKILLRLTKC